MKYLLILGLVLVGIWLWRTQRQAPPQRKPADKAVAEPQTMVRCAFCALHLPASDAIQGQKGLYCSAEHLKRAEP